MTESETTLIATATYNERETLPQLIERVRNVLPLADMLVVDDNSPDGTGQWVEQQATTESRIHCLHRPGKLGLGTATIDILRYAQEHDYTYVVALDADGSHDPTYIPEMLSRICQPNAAVDVVLGSRYVRGGGTRNWPLHRRWMSRAVNRYARTLLGLPVRDCSGAFRCIRVEFLSQVDLAAVESRGYSFFEEILWHFKRAGARFAEIPIVFVDREYGSSKINFREALTSLWMITRLGFRNWFCRYSGNRVVDR
jgi:dolichol-phosphate mannosyltransferase